MSRGTGTKVSPEPGLQSGLRMTVWMLFAVHRKSEDSNSSASPSSPLRIYTYSEKAGAEVCNKLRSKLVKECLQADVPTPFRRPSESLDGWILRILRWPSAPLSWHSWVLLSALVAALPLIQDWKRMEVCRRLSSCQMKLQGVKGWVRSRTQPAALRLIPTGTPF